MGTLKCLRVGNSSASGSSVKIPPSRALEIGALRQRGRPAAEVGVGGTTDPPHLAPHALPPVGVTGGSTRAIVGVVPPPPDLRVRILRGGGQRMK